MSDPAEASFKQQTLPGARRLVPGVGGAAVQIKRLGKVASGQAVGERLGGLVVRARHLEERHGAPGLDRHGFALEVFWLGEVGTRDHLLEGVIAGRGDD